MSAKARISRLRKSENLQKHTLIACILATISQATIIVLLGESNLNVLNMQPAPTYEAYIAELAAWTSDNFDAFWSHMIPDVLHPFFYSAAIMFTLTWALEKSQFSDKWDVLPLVPWLAGLLDEIENVAHIVGISSFPDTAYWTFIVGNPAAVIKWVIAWGCLLMIPIILVVGKRAHNKAG